LSESGNEQKQWGQKCFKNGHWEGKSVMNLHLPVQKNMMVLGPDDVEIGFKVEGKLQVDGQEGEI
jgi:hypothetical protein